MSQQGPSIDDLVQGFATHIKALKSPETKEATIRQNYIDPFWRALGWDVGDTDQRGPAEAEVIIEKTVETAESTGLPSKAARSVRHPAATEPSVNAQEMLPFSSARFASDFTAMPSIHISVRPMLPRLVRTLTHPVY
jgi:hypothetical protein